MNFITHRFSCNVNINSLAKAEMISDAIPSSVYCCIAPATLLRIFFYTLIRYKWQDIGRAPSYLHYSVVWLLYTYIHITLEQVHWCCLYDLELLNHQKRGTRINRKLLGMPWNLIWLASAFVNNMHAYVSLLAVINKFRITLSLLKSRRLHLYAFVNVQYSIFNIFFNGPSSSPEWT